MLNKLTLFIAAFTLAWMFGAIPSSAQLINPACDPATPGYADLDCNGDLTPNKCDFNDPLVAPYIDNLDCDGDGVPNGADACDFTVIGAMFGFGNNICSITGIETILPSGCSLAEVLETALDSCDDNPRNHGKFVSCVAKATNMLKKQKIISGAQKGEIQSCAAQTDIGKKPKPSKP